MSNRTIKNAMLRASGCEGKERFNTFAMATRVARRRSNRKSARFMAYHCKFCGGAHIGTSNMKGESSSTGIDPRQRFVVYAMNSERREVLIGYSNQDDGGEVAKRVTATEGWRVSRVVDRKTWRREPSA